MVQNVPYDTTSKMYVTAVDYDDPGVVSCSVAVPRRLSELQSSRRLYVRPCR